MPPMGQELSSSISFPMHNVEKLN